MAPGAGCAWGGFYCTARAVTFVEATGGLLDDVQELAGRAGVDTPTGVVIAALVTLGGKSTTLAAWLLALQAQENAPN